MPKKYRVNPSLIDFKNRSVVPTPVDDTQKVSFNFRRLSHKEDKFQYPTKESKYFIKLIERIRDLSHKTKKELISAYGNPSLRCHPIDFADTTETTFGILSEDVDDDAWQFEITQGEHGRVHGYFVGEVFYVVWLDPDHELYKGKKR